MSENTYKPRNYRVVRHVTKNRILDIQDALEIGKLRIELVEFAEGEGATLSVEHFAEPDALALVCYDILQGKPFEKYVEFKGAVQGEAAISRILVVERVQARNPIKVTVSRGPGKVVGQGAIQPLGKPEATLSVLLSEFDARRIALTVLRHLVAYEAATYHARVAAGTRRVTAAPGPAGGAEAADEPVPPTGADDEAPRPEPAAAAHPAAEPVPAPAAQDAPRQPDTASAAATHLTPERRAPAHRTRRGPAVETYWMAAQRLGVPREQAERIVEEADGDWGQAWSILRRWRDEAARRN